MDPSATVENGVDSSRDNAPQHVGNGTATATAAAATPTGVDANSNAAPTSAPGKRAPRPQKTPLQKEALEAAYKINQHPPEELRKALGDRLGLTEHQIQTWFNHRRRKEKKEQEDARLQQLLAEQRAAQGSTAGSAGPAAANHVKSSTSRPGEGQEAVLGSTAATGVAQGGEAQNRPIVLNPAVAASIMTPGLHPARPASVGSGVTLPDGAVRGEKTATRAASDTPECTANSAIPTATGQWVEFAELLALAKEMLPVPYREDGPRLGFQFDTPPKPGEGDEGEGEGGVKRKRVIMEGFEAEMEEGGDFQLRKRRQGESLKNARVLRAGEFDMHVDIRRLEDERRWEDVYRKEQERLEREKRKAEDKSWKEREKELERIHREQLKLAERMEKDRQRDEIRRLREAEKLRSLQEREQRKVEQRMEKEKKAEERRKAQEEKKKEREMLKVLAAHERNTTRIRARSDAATGPPDDMELEYEQLLLQQRYTGYGSDTGAVDATRQPDIQRPPFPPAWINLPNAFAAPLDETSGSAIVALWNFLYSFSDVLGMVPCSLDDLVTAVLHGSQHPLLGQVHMAMMRLLQADVEEAHAFGTVMGSPLASGTERSSCASVLDEAWAWGFDVDAWRAHQDTQTWPEVLRQFAMAAGLGGPRPKGKRVPKPKAPLIEGEDLVAGTAAGSLDSPLRLQMPARLGWGTVKAAAWQVLSEAGPEGLTVLEITGRIQEQGLRDLSTSKTPEATVAGALSRDAIFYRVAPSTYALQTILIHERKKAAADARGATPTPPSVTVTAAKEPIEAAGLPPAGAVVMQEEGTMAAVKQESGGGACQLPLQNNATHNGGMMPAAESGQHAVKSEATAAGAVEGVSSAMQPAAGASPIVSSAAANEEGAHNVSATGFHEAEDGRDEGDEEFSDEDDEEGREAAKAPVPEGEPWVRELQTTEYGSLPLSTRLLILERLMQLALETPSLRNVMDARKDASQRIRRRMFDEAKAEKKKRQAEAAARAAAYADEVAKHAAENPGAPPPPMKNHEQEEDPAAAKERAAARAEKIRKVEEANTIRVECLGSDRRYNKYWRFSADNVPDGGRASARVWVEDHETGQLRVLGTSEALEGLMSTLLRGGAREGPLYSALLRHKEMYSQYMPVGPLTLQPEDGHGNSQVSSIARLHTDSLRACTLMAEMQLLGSSINMAPRQPYLAGDSDEITQLKWDMLRVKAALPASAFEAGALVGWEGAVKSADTVEPLRDLLGQLEAAVQSDYLSQQFVREPLRVKGAWIQVGGEVASAVVGAHGAILQLADNMLEGSAPPEQPPQENEGDAKEGAPPSDPVPLCWLPPTVAAVALRLRVLDAALIYKQHEAAAREQLLAYQYIQRPALPQPIATALTEGKGGQTELVKRAAGKVHTVPSLMLMGRGKTLPTRLPPFPQVLQTQVAQPFCIDVERLMNDPPPREPVGPGRGRGGKPPPGPSRPASGRSTPGGGRGMGRGVPKLSPAPATSGATGGSGNDDDSDGDDDDDDEEEEGNTFSRGRTPNPNDLGDLAMDDGSEGDEDDDDEDISD